MVSGILDNALVRIGIAVAVTVVLMTIVLSFDVLPIYPIPQEIVDGFDWLFSTLWSFDFFIPVAVMVNAFSLIIALDIVFVTLKLILFLKKHLTQQH